eukprot:20382-Heterococcus_DN1.PRE.7
MRATAHCSVPILKTHAAAVTLNVASKIKVVEYTTTSSSSSSRQSQSFAQLKLSKVQTVLVCDDD